MEEANEIIDEVLNPQSALLWQWRSHLVKLLTQPLTSGEEDADGQEYARSLETQGEAETYLQAYAALLADRRETMTAERTLLAIHDVKEKKARKTKAAKKAAMALYDEDVQMVLEEVEAQPEDEVLRKELGDQRKALLEDHNTERAVRSVMVELSNIAASITRENDPERILADRGATQLRELLAEQGKVALDCTMRMSPAHVVFRRQAYGQTQLRSDKASKGIQRAYPVSRPDPPCVHFPHYICVATSASCRSCRTLSLRLSGMVRRAKLS